MELKTTVSTHGTQTGSFDGYVHDAAYAHALARALDERADNHEYFRNGVGVGVDSIQRRAAELMHEWGFEEKVTP